jgi:hypothetical protein
VSEAQKLRDKAFHARDLARALTDKYACAALETLAAEFETQAIELERQNRATGGQDKPVSRSDTP